MVVPLLVKLVVPLTKAVVAAVAAVEYVQVPLKWARMPAVAWGLLEEVLRVVLQRARLARQARL
jgi:hypothetical protein